MLRYRTTRESRTPLWFRQLVTFHLVGVGWFLFRMPTLSESWLAVSRLGVWGFDASQAAVQTIALLGVAIGIAVVTTATGLRNGILSLPSWAQGLLYALIAVTIYLVSGSGQQFIYFQF